MAGSRLRMMLHDGERLRDNRPVRFSRELNGISVQDYTKQTYRTDTKKYDSKELKGEEFIEIEGLRKNDDEEIGLQVYLVLMKGGKVIEMGLPEVFGADGKPLFLSAANLKLSDLEKALKNLPEDVELAIVWRLDKGYTQDIVITQDSMINRLVPQDNHDGFSLLNRRPPVGCGGGFGGDSEAVYDLTEVFIYTGERDDPIRMSSVISAAPPEVSGWDAVETFQPIVPVVSIQNKADVRHFDASGATDLSIRICWQDSLDKEYESYSVPAARSIEIPMPPVNEDRPAALLMLFMRDRPREEPPAIRLEQHTPKPLNEGERKVVKLLYGRFSLSADMLLPSEGIRSKVSHHREMGSPAIHRVPVAGPTRQPHSKPVPPRLKLRRDAKAAPAVKGHEAPPPRVPVHRIPAPSQLKPAKQRMGRKPTPMTDAPKKGPKIQDKRDKRKQEPRKLEKKVETKRKKQLKEPAAKPSSRVKPKRKKKPALGLPRSESITGKQQERRRKLTRPSLPQSMGAKKLAKAREKQKPFLSENKKPAPKRATRKRREMHPHYRKEMLGLTSRKKVSGRTRAGSSRGRRRASRT